MKELLKKNKEITAIGIFVLLIVTALWLGVLPLIRRIKDKTEKLQEKNVTHEVQRKRANDVSQLKERYEAIEEQESLLGKFIIREEAVDLIQKMEELAEKTNNSIKIEIIENLKDNQLANKKAKDKQAEKSIEDNLPSADYLKMKLDVSGSYNSIVDFVRRLENMEYYNDIVSINLSRAKGERPGTVFSATISPISDFSQISPDEPQMLSVDNSVKAIIEIVFYTKE